VLLDEHFPFFVRLIALKRGVLGEGDELWQVVVFFPLFFGQQVVEEQSDFPGLDLRALGEPGV